jgi:hypothetical protein
MEMLIMATKPGLYANIHELLRGVARRCARLAQKARQVLKTLKNLLKRLRRNNMPLKKSPSKEAFRQNVKAEVKAGKPVKQAVAIAYAVKRKAK